MLVDIEEEKNPLLRERRILRDKKAELEKELEMVVEELNDLEL